MDEDTSRPRPSNDIGVVFGAVHCPSFMAPSGEQRAKPAKKFTNSNLSQTHGIQVNEPCAQEPKASLNLMNIRW
jgi:hypothetical protein